MNFELPKLTFCSNHRHSNRHGLWGISSLKTDALGTVRPIIPRLWKVFFYKCFSTHNGTGTL